MNDDEVKLMAINRKEFEILCFIERNNGEKLSQRKIATGSGLSLGAVNKMIPLLIEKGLMDVTDEKNIHITEKGLSELEPYRVKRAVFMAAGFGSRLVPITLNTPKALVRIHGKPLIETLLDAVVKVGIEEIYIVRGYLGEQFDVLKNKYPNIVLIDNPDYKESNNISSAMKVKHLFKNAYVLDSDLYLKNPNLIRKYEYCASYVGVRVDKTDDWRLIVKNGRVLGMKIGGTDCYHMYNITYWTEEDGEKMEKFLPMLYNSPGGKENYWDNVPLDVYNKEFYIEPRECSKDDIIEIDTLSELQEIDPVYRF